MADSATKKRTLAAAATDDAAASDQPATRQKTGDAPALNANACLDPEHEGKGFKAVLELPPGALQGLREGVADKILASLGIKTIGDLGRWKFYKLAKAIVVLSEVEEDGKRAKGCAANINHGLDKAYEQHTFKQLLEVQPSAFQGLADWTEAAFSQLRIHTIADLASWKYARWAEALVEAAEFENETGGSA
ncbi:MAG: hypothetical protein J3K34DRAFT_444916 [Monoraphidium minutum]|nr:MAG: hypothetical protein J3K34DRAFT_444916 [Monoraphidium minutum]